MEELQELKQYLFKDATEPPAPDALLSIAEHYPYFAVPIAVLLREYRDDLGHERERSLRARLSILTGDVGKAEIQAAMGTDDSKFYPQAPSRRPDTESALDTFFSTYGKTSPEEDALLEKLIFNPVPDYSDLLAHEEGRDPQPDPADGIPDLKDLAEKLAAPDRRDHPAAQAQETIPAKAAHDDKATDDSLLSESLAKIFIKQGRYERAYEIISNLNLNYPEKSIYFADQLRFLRKLILIKQKQQQ